jgi:tRNA A-37 threonylcarbamoyl transferase component Bud32
VVRPNEIYLNRIISELGPEALAEVAGLPSSQAALFQVHVRTVSHPGIHPVGVAHIRNGSASACVFAKVQRSDYSGHQTLERELQFLSEVGPLISAENPMLRCPSPVAYYPERGLLLMEFVPGRSLKHHLFDLNYRISSTRNLSLPQLLEGAGQWLGKLHRLTMQNNSGNPLEWVLHELERSRTVEVFERYSQKKNYQELLSILRRYLDRNPGFRRNMCQVHGEFTPIHVMVAADAIYFVDFGNSKPGFVYEDVGLFTGFYDCLLPWRAAAGAARLNLNKQKEIFLKGYLQQAPAAFGPQDKAILRWVRLISSARMLEGSGRRYRGIGNRAYLRLSQRILHGTFAAHCREELEMIRNIPMDIFDEEPSAVHGHTGG